MTNRGQGASTISKKSTSAIAIICISFGILLGAALAFLIIPRLLPLREAMLARIPTQDFWEHNQILGWKNRSNFQGLFLASSIKSAPHIHTNSQGLRDREFNFEKPPGTFRILLIGDSYPAGFEVEMADHVKTLLEKKLSSEIPTEVINAGVRGYGTDQSYLYFITEGFRYSPDLVIYFFTGNDPNDNIVIHRPDRRYGKSYFRLSPDGPVLAGVPVPTEFSPKDAWLTSNPLASSFYTQSSKVNTSLKAIENVTQAIVRGTTAPPGALPIPPREVQNYQWEVSEALLNLMAKVSVAQKTPFLVYEVDPGHFPAPKSTKLEQLTSKVGLPLIVSRFKFVAESGVSRRLCFGDDLHWNELGHKLAAEVIFSYLKEHSLIKIRTL